MPAVTASGGPSSLSAPLGRPSGRSPWPSASSPSATAARRRWASWRSCDDRARAHAAPALHARPASLRDCRQRLFLQGVRGGGPRVRPARRLRARRGTRRLTAQPNSSVSPTRSPRSLIDAARSLRRGSIFRGCRSNGERIHHPPPGLLGAVHTFAGPGGEEAQRLVRRRAGLGGHYEDLLIGICHRCEDPSRP
jgi:hypothetical protein